MGPKRSIYSNRLVKYSIKAVTTYILPWAPQVLSAEDGERMILDDNCDSIDISDESFEGDEDLECQYERQITQHVDTENADSVASSSVTEFKLTERRSSSSVLSILKAPKSSDLARKIKC